MKKIVILGGGAGGLELAARLSRDRSLKAKIDITLIDNKLKHVWKPLLHEVAMGTLLSFEDEVDYMAYASEHHFDYQYGYASKLNRQEKKITVDAIYDENKMEVLPKREIPYDILVLAMGSISNDFNIPGISEHCFFLDTLHQAEVLNKTLMQHIVKIYHPNEVNQEPFSISIIGGGATGVELAAEIQYTLNEVCHLSKHEAAKKFKITLIESADRILPPLPKKLSDAAFQYLNEMGIEILTKKMVSRVNKDSVETKDGMTLRSDVIIWAAGIKADPITNQFDGLALNHLNQFKVTNTLQSVSDPSIFALGDCANCPQVDKKGTTSFVPPRAQAAHQEAYLLAKSLARFVNGKSLLTYQYKDYGSLITISKYKTVGNLMLRLPKSLYIEGLIARLTYWMLYKKHQAVLWGNWRVMMLSLGNALSYRLRPRLKLH